jgi:hypothetical protein
VLGKRRPPGVDPAEAQLNAAIARLGDRLAPDDAGALRAAFRDIGQAGWKRADDIAALRTMVEPDIAGAADIAAGFASRASERWASIRPEMAPSVHRDLIESILAFTIARER